LSEVADGCFSGEISGGEGESFGVFPAGGGKDLAKKLIGLKRTEYEGPRVSQISCGEVRPGCDIAWAKGETKKKSRLRSRG